MYLFGAGGHGKVIAEIAEANNIDVEGFIDDNKNLKKVLDYPVHHKVLPDMTTLFLSVGHNAIRKRLYEQFSSKTFKTLFHPSAIISKRTKILEGTVAMPGVVVNVDSLVGKQCILNTNCIIGHENIISNFVHISSNATLSGGVKIDEGCHIGAGAVIRQGVSVGKWAIIGAGAVVIRDVPDNAVVVGNPAKILKYNSP